jgi:transcriptional regulator of arginine metabolism
MIYGFLCEVRDAPCVTFFSCFRDAVYRWCRTSSSELDCMKSQRHSAIRELLVKATVTNQDELRRKLAGRGIHVTQATLSRDIRELKLMKGPTGYALPVVPDGEDDLPEIAGVLQDFGLEVRQAQNLLIVLTTMGGAQPVAASIDSEDWEEVVGTIAGDNTVLIICPDNRRAEMLRSRIEAYIA